MDYARISIVSLTMLISLLECVYWHRLLFLQCTNVTYTQIMQLLPLVITSPLHSPFRRSFIIKQAHDLTKWRIKLEGWCLSDYKLYTT